ncbi:MAG: hypothetical protein ACI3ZK_03505, partial [Candidatus Cryptobacteroides sp.]
QGNCASNGRKASIRERSLAQKEVGQWPGCLSVASSRPSPTSQAKPQCASPESHEPGRLAELNFGGTEAAVSAAMFNAY